MKSRRTFTAAVALVLPAFGAGAQAPSPSGPADSVVLTRYGDQCSPRLDRCDFPAVVLRRTELPAGTLDTVVARAAAAGFYSLPRDVPGNVDWCQIVLSDGLMSTLSIHHRRAEWSVRGYHYCLGDRSSSHETPEPPERKRLVALEALVDSIARLRRIPR